MAVAGRDQQDLLITLRYPDASLATIAYVTGGNARFPKETLDAASGGCSARLDNFAEACVWSGRKRGTRKARGGQDKGQRSEIEQFIEASRTGAAMPISLNSLVATTRATIAVAESRASGRPERV